MGRGSAEGPIDAAKDPEGYARLLKEREEKYKRDKKEEKQRQLCAEVLRQHKAAASQEPKPGRRAVVHGLQKNPEKNGSIGILQEYISDKDRWCVLFDSGSTNNFKMDNLLIIEDEVPETAAAADESEIPTPKIYVKGLTADTTKDHLIKLFGGIGTLAREPLRNAKGSTKGYEDEWPFAVKLYKPGQDGGDAMVEFVDKCSAKAAIKTFDGYTLKGARISVEYAGGGEEWKEKVGKPRERSRSRERLAEIARLKDSLRSRELMGDLQEPGSRSRF
eukprot:gnl/TRDRNA2_/TRDRNA2_109322_c0_seq1.p1 gnl/TRDRNA2_/TRDRNA2_109322_c0~~gnl/TRDRNA2_/TRDRNA2_109322_c0_seq1.p1  ORF type:complete len:276 (+),score=61.94 gnl/TRDRNA2_/TRDRNA2_109322_c0_seq1:69-896(+)